VKVHAAPSHCADPYLTPNRVTATAASDLKGNAQDAAKDLKRSSQKGADELQDRAEGAGDKIKVWRCGLIQRCIPLHSPIEVLCLSLLLQLHLSVTLKHVLQDCYHGP
jgi:hypothetical protein